MYDENNVFAKILAGEIKAEYVYQDDKVIAIKDAFPVAPVHILVIPKGKFTSFNDFALNSTTEDLGHFFKVVQEICNTLDLETNGYRIVSNIGEHGRQTVLHMHLHILAGKLLEEK